MTRLSRISTKKSSSIPTTAKYTAPPLLQPKATKKSPKPLPEWKPGGSGMVSPLQRLIDAKAAQAKLTIGQPNDKYEQEADAVAKDVVQRLHSPEAEAPLQETVQRDSVEQEEEDLLQAKPKDRMQHILQKKPMIQRVKDDDPDFVEIPLNKQRRKRILLKGNNMLQQSGRPPKSRLQELKDDLQKNGCNLPEFYKYLEEKQYGFGTEVIDFLSYMDSSFYKTNPNPESIKIRLNQIQNRYFDNNGKQALNRVNDAIKDFEKTEQVMKKLSYLWSAEKNAYGNDLKGTILQKFYEWKEIDAKKSA